MFSMNIDVDRRIIALAFAAAVSVPVGVITSATVAIPAALAVFALVIAWGQITVEPPEWMISLAQRVDPDAAGRTQAFCRLAQLSLLGVGDIIYGAAGGLVEYHRSLRIAVKGVQYLFLAAGALYFLLYVLLIASSLILGEFSLAGEIVLVIGGALLGGLAIWVAITEVLPRLAEACPIRLKRIDDADAV